MPRLRGELFIVLFVQFVSAEFPLCLRERIGRESTQQAASWATEHPDGTLLRLSVRSGPKVKQSLLTNKSELRRVATAGFVCIDLAPSRNTERKAQIMHIRIALQHRKEAHSAIFGFRILRPTCRNSFGHMPLPGRFNWNRKQPKLPCRSESRVASCCLVT
ncbi:unnamed protein product [Symbiodinium pilosum]|uniref:Secreted protein n=1 Tax=Symbiodinium pilosum TaxID=2952 RepID=A0A812NRQ1_SYMPI|nr:unnamed protein product [Symbiodinium pilosum]